MTTAMRPGITAGGAPAKRHLQHPVLRDAVGRPLSYCRNVTRRDLLTTDAAETTCDSCREARFGWRVKEAD